MTAKASRGTYTNGAPSAASEALPLKVEPIREKFLKKRVQK